VDSTFIKRVLIVEKLAGKIFAISGFTFQIFTRGNGSQISLESLKNVDLPTRTFWIDMQYKIEQLLNVLVIGMELRPSDLRKPNNRDILHIIHKPRISSQELAVMTAHAEIEELQRLHAI